MALIYEVNGLRSYNWKFVCLLSDAYPTSYLPRFCILFIMDSVISTQIDLVRFASYVEELKEFSTTHNLRFGTPDTLLPLSEKLRASTNFRSELRSMLRSVFYREAANVSPAEFLTLIAFAWGGESVLAVTPELQDSLSLIVDLVRNLTVDPKESDVQPQAPEAPTEKAEDLKVVETQEKVASPSHDDRFTRARHLSSYDDLSTLAPEHSVVSVISDLHAEIQLLEKNSSEVRRYLELLKQRDELILGERLPRDNAPESAKLQTLSEEAYFASPGVFTYETESYVREDPWDENSALQKELRLWAEQQRRILQAGSPTKARTALYSFKRKFKRLTQIFERHANT